MFFNQYIEPQLRYGFYVEKVISFILSAQNETKAGCLFSFVMDQKETKSPLAE